VVIDVLGAVVDVKTQDGKGKLVSNASSTGIRNASLMRSQVASASYWVTQSTALMW